MPNEEGISYLDFINLMDSYIINGSFVTTSTDGIIRPVKTNKKNQFNEKINKIIADNISFIRERDLIENECARYKNLMEDQVKSIIANKADLSNIFDFFIDIGVYLSFINMSRSDIVPTMVELYFQLDTDTYNQMVATFTDLLKHKEHPRHKVAKVFLIIKSYIEKTAYARNNESIRIVRNGGRVDRKSFGEIEVAEF